jgi:deazaflavin-dependent oxidoreductase (nitroreductase family)
MGLAADLSYAVPPPNLVQRGTQAFASTRPGAWAFSRSLATMDRVVSRVSGGRTSVPRLMAGLPVLVLTTTGRRSGQPRASHLIAVPFADTLALIGSNFGQPDTPAWVLNLEAEPRAAVTYRGVTRDVVSRPATAAEQDQVMADSARVYGGYLKYQQRITGRRLRIFILD